MPFKYKTNKQTKKTLKVSRTKKEGCFIFCNAVKELGISHPPSHNQWKFENASAESVTVFFSKYQKLFFYLYLEWVFTVNVYWWHDEEKPDLQTLLKTEHRRGQFPQNMFLGTAGQDCLQKELALVWRECQGGEKQAELQLRVSIRHERKERHMETATLGSRKMKQ